MPLAVQLDARAVFETFVAESNSAVVAHLQSCVAGDSNDVIWLFGAPGRGKSHLLQAACRSAGLAGRRAMYIPLGSEERVGPDALIGLEDIDLLALDELDSVAGHPIWEGRLFSILESFHACSAGLLLAARNPPAAVGFSLPDLASRAAGAIVYRLNPLSEHGQLLALMTHARFRGLELDEATARYMLSRVEREMTGLCQWLDRLDRASLIEQRKLTIPFIRKILAADTHE